jgi:hypothetical protein
MKTYYDEKGNAWVTDSTGNWFRIMSDGTVGTKAEKMPKGNLTPFNIDSGQTGTATEIPQGDASATGVNAIVNQGFPGTVGAGVTVNIEPPRPQMQGGATQPKVDANTANDTLKKWFITKDPMYAKISKLTGTTDFNANAGIFSKAVQFAQATGDSVVETLGNEQFKSVLASTGGATTSVYRVITDPAKATKDFLKLVTDYFGQDMLAKLDPKDTTNYLQQLNALEKKSGQKTTYSTKGGVTTQQQVSAGVTDADREQLALSILQKYIPGGKDIANVGGLIGSNYNTLKTLTSAYGVTLPDGDLRQLALNSLTSKTAIDDAKAKVQTLAKATYRNLAPFIDQGLTVKDIASQYINRMSNVLEISPDGIDLNDRYIQEVLSADKLPSLNEFTIKLRNTPMWQKTGGAIEEAASYAKKILSDFGLI